MDEDKDTKLNNKINNIRKIVDICCNTINDKFKNIKINDNDISMNLVSDYTNPDKKELAKVLSRIAEVQAYYSNVKLMAGLLYSLDESNLSIKEYNARKECIAEYEAKLAKYELDIRTMFNEAVKNNNDKALSVVKELIRTTKPKEPTDKELDMRVKAKTKTVRDALINTQAKYDKLKEMCRLLDVKFTAARALYYDMQKDPRPSDGTKEK